MKHSEIQKAWSSKPEARKKNSEAQLRDEVRNRKSNAMKKVWKEKLNNKKTHRGRKIIIKYILISSLVVKKYKIAKTEIDVQLNIPSSPSK